MNNRRKHIKTSKESLKHNADNNRLLTPKQQLDLLANAYVRARRKMYESAYGDYDYPAYIITSSHKIVYHIDTVIESMGDYAKLILENEVKNKRTGGWYREYYSTATYYRIREQIYNDFLTELNK